MFTFDPSGVALVLLLVALYARAVTVLRRRGYDVPRVQQLWWYLGTALIAVSLIGPPDALSEDLFSAHMAQHLLLADIAAPLLLAGVRTPVLMFMPPRGLLVALARNRPARSTFRFLRKPLVAVPLWVVVLYTWHFRFAFEASLEHPVVHLLQHASFFFASLLVWWAVVDPKHRHARGELWKIAHVIGMRLSGMFLGMAFIIMSSQAYPLYGDRPELHGIDPLRDQQYGGGMMLLTDLVVMLFALGFFFWRAAADDDRRREAEQRAAAMASSS